MSLYRTYLGDPLETKRVRIFVLIKNINFLSKVRHDHKTLDEKEVLS